jgi:hypothetical protein
MSDLVYMVTVDVPDVKMTIIGSVYTTEYAARNAILTNCSNCAHDSKLKFGYYAIPLNRWEPFTEHQKFIHVPLH